MSLESLLANFRSDHSFMRDVAAWERVPARPARYALFPATLDRRLIDVLRARGIDQLYTHQAASIEATAVAGGALLATETRVAAVDADARRAFRRYWLVGGPCSGLIRRRGLAAAQPALR